jgi:methyl-accepting chemotaxis protein
MNGSDFEVKLCSVLEYMAKASERQAMALERIAAAQERQADVAEQQADILDRLTYATPTRVPDEAQPLTLRVRVPS